MKTKEKFEEEGEFLCNFYFEKNRKEKIRGALFNVYQFCISDVLIRNGTSTVVSLHPSFPSRPAVREYARVSGHIHEAFNLLLDIFAHLSSSSSCAHCDRQG